MVTLGYFSTVIVFKFGNQAGRPSLQRDSSPALIVLYLSATWKILTGLTTG